MASHSTFLYGPFVNAARPPCNRLRTRVSSDFFRYSGGPPPERWAGSTSSASISEMISTAITTVGITRRICPICPCAKSSGRNATHVEAMVRNTGTATSRAPFTTATTGGSPRSMCS